METSIRIVDYHLKERIEGQNPKITLSPENKSFFFCSSLGMWISQFGR